MDIQLFWTLLLQFPRFTQTQLPQGPHLKAPGALLMILRLLHLSFLCQQCLLCCPSPIENSSSHTGPTIGVATWGSWLQITPKERAESLDPCATAHCRRGESAFCWGQIPIFQGLNMPAGHEVAEGKAMVFFVCENQWSAQRDSVVV